MTPGANAVHDGVDTLTFQTGAIYNQQGGFTCSRYDTAFTRSNNSRVRLRRQLSWRVCVYSR
jgi:hypothetical protein